MWNKSYTRLFLLWGVEYEYVKIVQVKVNALDAQTVGVQLGSTLTRPISVSVRQS